MRRFAPAVLLAVVSTIAACGSDQPSVPDRSSPEGMARLAFSALKDDQLERLRPTFVTPASIRTLFEAQAAKGASEDRPSMEEGVAKRGGYEKIASDAAEHALRRYASARRQAAEKFDWKSAEFDGVKVERERMQEGMKTASVTFFAKAAGKRWGFFANDASIIDSRWTFSEGVGFAGEETPTPAK